MIRTISTVLLTAAGTVFLCAPTRPPHPLIVHEWGTVTTRHAVTGATEGCLNRVAAYDPLPGFVHLFDPALPASTSNRRIPLNKGVDPVCRPDVTMRLETPVLYFHPARGDSIAPFDVSVDFRGGLLNEFYPNALTNAHGWNGKQLTDGVVSTLEWRGVTLNDRVSGPVTQNRVWLATRAVSSRPLTTSGESEQYIFYRGLAHLDAVLRTRFVRNELQVRGPRSAPWLTSATEPLGHIWMLDVRAYGFAAFRESDSLTLVRGDTAQELARFRDFAESDYSRTAMDGLRASMERALVGRGLYPDEARAMLETWKRSYFLEPGLRLFYIAPSDWVSYHLPLRISTPHVLTRVIVGRIELPPAASP